MNAPLAMFQGANARTEKRRRFLPAWPLVFAVTLPLQQASAEDTVVGLPPTAQRPSAEAGTTKISVGVWVGDVTQIDSVAQTFSANLLLVLRWRDPSLAHSEPGMKVYQLADIWSPRWLIVNEVGSLERSLPETAEVAPDGSAIYRQRIVGSFIQVLNLRAFPFDHDTFRIHLIVAGYRAEEIQFVPDESFVAAGFPHGAGIAPKLTVQEWRVTSSTTRVLPYNVAPSLEVAGYAFEFTAYRNARHFVVKVIIPLVLIVLMSFAVFWIEPSNASSQISLAVTSVLTLIAYRFSVDAEVPKLPYITRLDAFILASTLLVFLSLVEVIVTTKLAEDGRLALARTIDRRARVIAPAILAVISAAIFLR